MVSLPCVSIWWPRAETLQCIHSKMGSLNKTTSPVAQGSTILSLPAACVECSGLENGAQESLQGILSKFTHHLWARNLTLCSPGHDGLVTLACQSISVTCTLNWLCSQLYIPRASSVQLRPRPKVLHFLQQNGLGRKRLTPSQNVSLSHIPRVHDFPCKGKTLKHYTKNIIHYYVIILKGLIQYLHFREE